jgi:hypothetical protein
MRPAVHEIDRRSQEVTHYFVFVIRYSSFVISYSQATPCARAPARP